MVAAVDRGREPRPARSVELALVDRADVHQARRIERVNRQVGPIHGREHRLARIAQPLVAADVIAGASGECITGLQQQIAPDEEQDLPAACRALDGIGDPRNRLRARRGRIGSVRR